MSDQPIGQVTDASTDEGPEEPRSKQTESVSATLPGDLADKLKQRADEEDRTQSALIKRAVKAYMKGWVPGQEEDD